MTTANVRGTGSAASPPVDGLQEILAWSAQCPDWQRDALRRLCAGADIEASDDAELLEILKGRCAAEVLSSEHIRLKAKASQSVVLKSIRNVSNVNALAANQTLSFYEKGMTIVYGENGAGKSGYVRILKSACRARRLRSFDILPNIYGPSSTDAQTANINYLEGTTNRSSQWIKGQAGPAALSAVSVFDASAGDIHVTGTNDIAYTPFPLLVLSQLARTADSLRSRLTEETKQLGDTVPPTVTNHECSKHTATGKLLQNLSGKTNPKEIDALCTLSDAEKAELLKLRKDLADDPAAIATRSLKLAQRLEGLGTMMVGTAAALDDEAIAAILDLTREITAKTEAVRIDAEHRFAKDPLPVGSLAWQAMWDAAQVYAETEVHPGEAFPSFGDASVCVLCQRPFDPMSADRLDRLKMFVADELGKEIKRAQASLSSALNFDGAPYLNASKIAEIRAFFDNIEEPHLAKAISGFLLRAAWRRRWAARANAARSHIEAPPLGPSTSGTITAAVDALRTKARVLQSAVTSPEHKALKDHLDALSDREWLSVVKDDVLKAVAVKRNIETLQALIPQTARARITSKSTTLSKELVTDRLRDRFAHEVSDLGISRLRVELRQERSEAGQPRFKICFIAKPAENVGAVLSEGELRCLAAAAFLAELETADGSSGIVLDDPISSLDHVHRASLAKRLAREALQRQVIVFTHDIPFLSQLQHACKESHAALVIRLVSRGGTVPGFCHDQAPATHRPVVSAIDSLGTDLNNKRHLFETGDPRWGECVTGFGGVLRMLWERAVEEVISPVLTRWTHDITTPGFIKLTVLTPADHTIMREGFKRCSILEHYQPSAGNIPLPTADDISVEIARMGDWFLNIKQRQESLPKP